MKVLTRRKPNIHVGKIAKLLLLLVMLINVFVFVIRDSNSNSFSFDFFGDDKIDWHDYAFIAYEKNRTGPGEQGRPIVLTDPVELAENEKGYKLEGIYTVVNDKIDNQRSLPDIRLPVCKTRKYLKKLPSTSVIVIFYNENWKLLMRCLHSIYNRTPHKLLKEIILVSDKSTDEKLGEPLKAYIKEHFSDKVKFFINEARKGLIVTRMEGARKATGEVIVFLDSHIEVNVNWLPPLLEPIAENHKTAVVPIFDSFSPYTLEYQTLGHGARGSFDWTLCYQWLLLTRKYQKTPGDVYQLSAMTGGAYAINREYFFELGGYDEGLIVWNGENYELSFKLHLCGGNLVQVPCSRVSHTTKHRTEYREQNYNVDFSKYNLKRVAEVWLDEYKEALYRTDPKTYYKLDPGDLTKALEVKKRLQCKPFKYYLEVIAPDLFDHFPPFDKPNFASGAIFSEANPSKCITYVGPTPDSPTKLTECSQNLTYPNENQYFDFTWHRFIKYHAWTEKKMCIDTVAVNMYTCHFDFGNQFWKFDLKTHQLINPPSVRCITSDDNYEKLFMSPCNEFDMHQKFNWGSVDVLALANWETEGVKIRDDRKKNEVADIIRADGPSDKESE